MEEEHVVADVKDQFTAHYYLVVNSFSKLLNQLADEKDFSDKNSAPRLPCLLTQKKWKLRSLLRRS